MLIVKEDFEAKAVLAAAKKAGKGLFAVVATAGTTNFGIVDRLDEVGKAAKNLVFGITSMVPMV